MKKEVKLDVSQAVSVVAASPENSPISILPVLALDPQLAPFREAADNLAAQSERALIDTERKWQKGSDFLTVCDEQWDQLEALRKATKGPVDDYGKFIQAIFVPIQQRVAAAKLLVSNRMSAFQLAEEARRKKVAEDLQKANEEAAAKLAQEAEDRGDTDTAQAILEVATTAPVPVAPLRLGGTNSYGRSTFNAKRWTASVEKPFEVLQAILDGKLPVSLIEWKQSELNKEATKLKVEKVVHGLKVFQTSNLQQR